MYIPQVREQVQLAGRSGVFLVMWVDHEQKEADLISLHRASSVEESVSFSELQAIQPPSFMRYIENRFLKTA